MKNILLLAGATMLAASMPAAADPGKGQGKGHGKGNHAAMKHGKAHKGSKAGRGVVVSDRYGRLYALGARGSCPPGLAKRGNGCMSPGQARKMYSVGQRYNRNFGTTWTYNQNSRISAARSTVSISPTVTIIATAISTRSTPRPCWLSRPSAPSCASRHSNDALEGPRGDQLPRGPSRAFEFAETAAIAPHCVA